MTSASKISKLDFFTMKSQSAMYLSLVLIVFLFGFMNSSVTLLCITGAWFAALMSSNIFAVQEKNNLDRLYGSVSVSLRDIVLGRYVFVFLNFVMSFLLVIIVYTGFALFENNSLQLSNFLLAFSLSLLIFSAITGIQMPLFFRLGYTKAKLWSIVPFIAVMALVAAPSFLPVLSRIIELIKPDRPVLNVSAVLASLVIQLLSYLAAVKAYRRRKRG